MASKAESEIKTLETQIDRLSKSVDGLRLKAEGLQKQMSSGTLGTDQIKRIAQDIERIQTRLSSKQTKLDVLVDKRSQTDLNILNKTIETLQKNIALGKGSLGLFKTDDAQYQKLLTQIKNAETALASFESRKFKQFTPAGVRKTAADIASENSLVNVDLEERLRKIQPPTIAPSQINLEQRLRTARPIEDQIKEAHRIADEFLKQNAQREKAIILEERLAKARATTNATTTGQGAGTTINRPTGAGEPQGLLDASQRQRVSLLGLADASNRAAGAEEKGKGASKGAAEARAKAAQELARGNRIFQEAIALAERYGLSLENLRKVQTRGGGITQATFQGTGKTGIPTTLNTFINESTGKATAGLSSQFRSFGQDVLRDIGQFTKWSIAVAVVYTPLKKLGELLALMIDNESRLADATIAANVSFEKSGEIFDAVAIAAERSGESINTTIDAYAQAIRAAGRYGDEQTKTQKATALLNSALTLSKLSTLDQATSIDTLTAALLQADLELDQGEQLLNKWVRVSQVANVTMDGLAVGVAVLGDAAETSGLDIDHLNALIAVLSEQSISGSKEAANTAKALIGAYQSDKAEAALNRYGFSLRKANGEVREFLDVYQDLAKAREKGILPEPAVGEIALALGGGGVRRAKDASALINSQERLNEIAGESAKIGADSTLAQDSLAKKLQTVQTATTQAANTFQSLAQTLGDDGGVLDSFKLLLNVITGVTKGADDLFKILGRSGPILSTFAVGLLALRAMPDSRRSLLSASILGDAAKPIIGPGGVRLPGTQGGAGLGRTLLSDVVQMNNRGGTLIGAAGVGLSAISNIQAGRKEQAAANVMGGLIGAAIGAAIIPGGLGIAIGANIGSSAGNAFITSLTTHSQDLKDYFAETLPKPGEGITAPTGATLPKELSLEELLKQGFEKVGGGNEIFGGLRAQSLYSSRLQPGATKDRFATPESAMIEILKDVDSELYSRIKARYDVQIKKELPVTANPEIARLQGLAEQERARQLTKVSTGELRPSQFGQISERLAGFPVTAKKEMDAFGQAFIDVSGDIDNTTQAYQGFLELTVEGTSEQQAQINSYVTDIQKLQAEWENWKPTTKDLTLDLTTGTKTFETQNQLGDYLKQTQQAAAQFTTSSITQARLQQLKLPGITGGLTEATPAADIELIRNQAKELQNQFYTDMTLTNEEIEHLTSSLEDFAVLVERAGEDHFDTISGIDQKFWDAAQKLLVEQGKLADKKGFGFQKFDIDRGQLEQLAQQSIAQGQAWSQQFPGFETKPEDLLAITNDGIAKPIHADFKILALLLEKLVDQGQKQLDGQYNIPEGATFWVPLTAAYYRNKIQDMGGLGGLDLGENTNATDQNTSALNNLSSLFNQAQFKDYMKSEKTLVPIQEGAEIRKREESTYLRSPLKYGGDLKLREEPGYTGASKQQPSAMQTFWQGLLAELKNLFSLPQGDPSGGRFRGGLGIPGTSGRDVRNGTTQTNPQLSTRLNLNFQSTTNMLIDGRVVATALQSHLASDLLRTEGSTGSISKRYII